MTTDTWNDKQTNDDSWTTGADWSAGVPTSSSDVVVAVGEPIVENGYAFTVHSITDSATITFVDAGASTVLGTVNVTKTGNLLFDPPGPGSYGGSSLAVDGALTNAGNIQLGTSPNAPGYTIDAPDTLSAASLNNTGGTLQIWGGPSVLAQVDVNGSASLGTAAGILDGVVTLSDDSLLQFTQGSITTIAARSELSLTGKGAQVDDAGAGANSALTGLTTLRGALYLQSAAAVNTGLLTVYSGASIVIDAFQNDGGSALNVNGALAIHAGGSVNLGSVYGQLSAATNITAKSVNNAGALVINGYGYAATLTVGGRASFSTTAGELTGDVSLSDDALIAFGSGEITTIDGELTMFGASAAIDDKGGAQNSALKGITSVDDTGQINLEGASLTTTGALTNQGYLYLDNFPGDGGAKFTVDQSIVNEGRIWIGEENDDLTSSSSLIAAAVDNVDGFIALRGDSAYQALLDIKGPASLGVSAGLLDGNVNLQGGGAIEFLSGALTTIDSGAEFTVYGAQALVEDASKLGSNSALKITTDNGVWSLYEGDTAASASLTIGSSGELNINSNGTGGASTLTIAGALNNQGDVALTGVASTNAALSVAGATTNNGAVYVTNDVETLAGAVAGTGAIYLSGATLTLDTSVSSGQTVEFNSASTLALGSAVSNSFLGTLENFGAGDVIDAEAFTYGATSYNFLENSGGTGGTLTLIDGSLQENILLTGSYSPGDFQKAMDSGTGTLLKFA